MSASRPSPLLLRFDPIQARVVSPGTTTEVFLNIRNQGRQTAEILVTVEAEVAPLRSWLLTPRERLVLGPDQTGQVTLRFQVPALTPVAKYPYTVILDAPQHYPDETPLRYAHALEVTNPDRTSSGSAPLKVVLDPPGSQVVYPGDSFDLGVVVTNRDTQSPTVVVSVVELSQMYQWCQPPRQGRFSLGPGQYTEVTFHFQIPDQALSGTYEYGVLVEAPEHYPDPILRSQLLVIQPRPANAQVRDNDPTFILNPVTSPELPALLTTGTPYKPSSPLTVTVQVHNRSNQVDRFQVTCPDLEEAWYTVRYQGGSLGGVGIISGATALELNPGTRGEVIVLFQPPQGTLAGVYAHTIQVTSANNRALNLLDLLYLQVPPVYELEVELRTILGKVAHSEGQYAVKLVNRGNTVRELTIQALHVDEDDLCTFRLEPSQARLLPGKTANIDLRVQPRPWWRQPLFGAGRDLNFRLDLEDAKGQELPPNLPQSTLLWRARPWWQLAFVAISILGLIGAVVLLVLWLQRPPEPPKLTVTTEDYILLEGKSTFIFLNWRIENVAQVKQLDLSGQRDGIVDSSLARSYDFSKGDFGGLKCPLEGGVLTCTSIRTAAKRPGKYRFKLTARTKQGETVVQDADVIEIKPTPKAAVKVIAPRIISFTIDGKPIPPSGTKLTFEVNDPKKPVRDPKLLWQVEGTDVTVDLIKYGAPNTVGPKPTQSDTYTLNRATAIETITLRVTPKTGNPISRTVTIQTIDKTPIPEVPPAPLPPATPAPATKNP
ncbi:COG1470 family protein [Anthocerotibacter panamensis]|uniref:COG1470 family protein n=1 Tax=Anthocerotibacter panamensis TaxID=2857077 RepID=UPI001C40857D|nr:hypothetical protein [Anthocerotibacter panamensis]